VKQRDPRAEKKGRQGCFARAEVKRSPRGSDEIAAEEDHLRAIRGRLLSFLRAPNGAGDSQSYRYIEDGIILVKDGRVEAVGPADSLSARLPAGTPVDRHADALIMPGFIDPHIHYPQTQVIASYGAQLLEWLEKYTFVEEEKFADPAHAAQIAEFFLDELARNGTTTACAYGSASPNSADALFAAAHRRGVGMIAGTAIMDRNGPPALLAAAHDSIAASRDLIRRWHGTGRQRYAVTPRFAITSTGEQLAATATLLEEFPTVLLQTHLAENHNEIATIKRLFPDDASYTAVYARFGLLGPRSLLGHCIHLDKAEIALLRNSKSVAVLCPTSNFFLGSGLFNYEALAAAGVRIALATDVGGGTSYSMLQTAAEAYKVMQLQGQKLPALVAFDLMTRGNAAALGLDKEIGTISPGAFADLVVLDARITPAMSHRMEVVRDLEDELFVLMTLGDDRAVRQTYIAGQPVLSALRGGDAGATA
jgi:guanine deaminase